VVCSYGYRLDDEEGNGGGYPSCVCRVRGQAVDGVPFMEIRDAVPTHYKNKRLPWAPINITATGDWQYGSAGCDIPKLKDYIQEALANDSYFGFMGDAHDVMSPSNRRKYQNAGFYDNATDWYENKMMEDIEYLYEDVLKSTKGRWLWWLEGHHFWEFSDGSTTDTELCRRLEAPFVGTCGFLRATFHQENSSGKGGKSLNCDIWCHHGAGGGTTVGAVLNKLERVAGSFSADLYFQGHANRLGAVPKPLLELGGSGRNLYLKNRDRYLVATGAFDKGYTVGSTAGRTGRPRGGYVEQGMMLPTGLGAPMVTVGPVIKKSEGVERTELSIRVTV
jgi:hypothetical protein